MPTAQQMQRLNREKADVENNYKDTLKLVDMGQDPPKWQISFEGAAGSVYQGEFFTL